VLKAIRRRLAGEVPLDEAFYNDMLAVGSMVNIAIGLCAFAMIAADFPIWLPIIVFLSPQPYNIILLISVFRSASQSQGRRTDFMKAATIVWFVVMFFV
jgi:hypothetical protein